MGFAPIVRTTILGGVCTTFTKVFTVFVHKGADPNCTFAENGAKKKV